MEFAALISCPGVGPECGARFALPGVRPCDLPSGRAPSITGPERPGTSDALDASRDRQEAFVRESA